MAPSAGLLECFKTAFVCVMVVCGVSLVFFAPDYCRIIGNTLPLSTKLGLLVSKASTSADIRQQYSLPSSVNADMASIDEEAFLTDAKRISNDTSLACRHFDFLPVLFNDTGYKQKDPAIPRLNSLTLEANQSILGSHHKKFLIPCEARKPWVVLVDGKYASLVTNTGNVTCNFTELLRINDYDYLYLQTTTGKGPYEIRFTDVLEVNCSSSNDGSRWAEVFFVPTDISHPAVAKKFAGWKHLPRNSLKLNIIIWLFDSISRNGFIRNMPKSWKYMAETMNNGILFKGYNVFGVNTLPNVLPLHMGFFQNVWVPTARKRFAEDSNYTASTLFDHFRKNGYVTAYYEDWQYPNNHGTFVTWQHLRGFRNPLADHLSRTFMISRARTTGEPLNLCVHNQTANSFAQNYFKSLWKVHADKPKYFFCHESTYTHEYEENISIIDEEFLGFLQWLNSPSIRNNTMAIIMSDHGNMRSNPWWKSFKGQLEVQMPLAYAFLPDWMDQLYPTEMGHLRQNAQERLTTSLDLHHTLKNFLHFPNGNGHFVPVAKENDAVGVGYSLFHPTPKNRTCQDAGIELHWCACLNPKKLDIKTEVVLNCAKKAMKVVNDHINGEMRKSNVSRGEIKCGEWMVKEVQSAWLLRGTGATADQVKRKVWQSKFLQDDSHYSISFTAEPGNTAYHITASYELYHKACDAPLEYITRRDRYDRHSYCIDDKLPQLRRWCYCIGEGEPIKTGWN